MTGPVIKPVVPSTTRARQDGQSAVGQHGTVTARRTLPLPAVPEPRDRGVVYGLAAVDARGRVADQAVLRALGWTPGTRLAIRETRGLLITRTDPHGVFSVTTQGHLRLPAPVRHCCGLLPGDRVLLTAEPAHGTLVVHPPAVLDDMIAHCHSTRLDGDTA
ncbi:AbrB/MazE/SpoVT family DNA-binding domain-containing protein [Saccharopolyspora phatthalungensis]|uniref:SpoVT-AbrB domain-containing protein n=1 Tax=Saccharopolyspora phatthalungensis TaxID=664693 RepID=A0A840QAZ2_9PSEU|nr:AbrB/MazE/SpoVT family DNA-binding domain-containing protein [Saccharopolyspora phatthalungensis]MBB5157586.1 hypothetical protein [Saccharopolyspora phatthalungensis]